LGNVALILGCGAGLGLKIQDLIHGTGIVLGLSEFKARADFALQCCLLALQVADFVKEVVGK
jgi:hypothetical protein